MGAGSAADAQLVLECSWAVARHEDTAEMCSTDIANAFGSLHRERESLEHRKLTLFSCCLNFASVWHENGNRSVDERAQRLAPNLAYADGFTVWEEKPSGLRAKLDSR